MRSTINYTSVIPQPTYLVDRRRDHHYLTGKYLGFEYRLQNHRTTTVYLDISKLGPDSRHLLGKRLTTLYGNPDGYYRHPRYHCLNYYANGYTLSYRRGPGKLTSLFQELSGHVADYDLELANDISNIGLKYRILVDYFNLPHLVTLIIGYLWGLSSPNLF
jgi:hypothetical protein